VLIAFCEGEEAIHQADHALRELHQELAPVEAKRRHDLIVTGATGVDLLPGLTEPLGEKGLDGGVPVLLRRIDAEAAGLVLPEELVQALPDAVPLCGLQ
jgi:hypothetical protein